MSAVDEFSDGTKWEGYSNYELVSRRVSQSVSDALDSYALIESAHSEGASIKPERAAQARADILSAAIRLLVEMEEEESRGVDEYNDILDRWMKPDDEDAEGNFEKLQDVQLHTGMPGWMFQMVVDIRKAAWSLGYLQAGRRSKQEPDDPVEAEAQAMFEGL